MVQVTFSRSMVVFVWNSSTCENVGHLVAFSLTVKSKNVEAI